MSDPAPDPDRDDIDHATAWVTPLLTPQNPETPKGFFWRLRLYCLYMPVITFVVIPVPVMLVQGLLIEVFPNARAWFVTDGGSMTWPGFLLAAAALLPLALFLSRSFLWLVAEDETRTARNVTDMPSGRLWLTLSLLWFVAMAPILVDRASHYFSLGVAEVVIGQGPFAQPHHHYWSELQGIKSSCKSGRDGFTASYVMSFAGGDQISVPLGTNAEIGDFLNAWRTLVPTVRGLAFAFSYDGDSSCPTDLLIALSVKPGDAPKSAVNH